MHVTTSCKSYILPDGRVLLLNTLSGALDIVPPSVWAALRAVAAGESASLETETESQLRARAYVFDSRDPEQKYLTELAEACLEAQRRQPVQFILCPTFSCNMACRYCFEGALTAAPGRVMTDADVALAFDAIERIQREMYPECPSELLLFGGEPFMNSTRTCVEAILREASRRSLTVDAVTNGLQAAEVLASLPEDVASVHRMQITIDGPREVHDRRRPLRGGAGSFDRIVRSVDALLARGVQITVRVNVDRENLGDIAALVEYMEDRGWIANPRFSCYVFPVTGRTGHVGEGLLSEDEALSGLQKVFRNEGKDLPGFALHGFKVLAHVASVLEPETVPIRMTPLMRYCEATALKYFAFGPDGLVYPCGQAVGRGPSHAIGTYSPALTLWEDRCKAWGGRSIMTMPKCRSCHVATLCGGGCALEAFDRTGDLDAPDCRNAEETVDRYITDWIERVHGTV